MSYAPSIGSFGETKSWWRWEAPQSDIFLWRAQFDNAQFLSVDDALEVVSLVGKLAAEDMDMSTLGIAIDGKNIDVVVRCQLNTYCRAALTSSYDAKEIADKIKPDLLKRHSALAISNPEWLQIAGPFSAIDFWRAHPVLWDQSLADQGQPTGAFAKADGVYIGKADGALKPMPGSGKKPPPLVDDKKSGDKSKAGSDWFPAVLLAGTAAVVWLGIKR